MQFFFRRILTLFVAITLSFFLLRILPGDPITAELTQVGAGETEIARQRAQFGLDQFVLVQFADYVANLFRGDLGNSFSTNQSVSAMIMRVLPDTLLLGFVSLLFAVLMGVTLGIGDGFQVRRGIGAISRSLLTLSLSIPIYWSGTLAIYLFASQLQWLPASGNGTLGHLVLPVSVLAFHTSGSIGQLVASSIRETRSMTFIRTAHAKGLPPSTVVRRHILRVGLLPIVTVIALQAGFVFSGVVITEVLFARPGLGQLLLDATLRRDYPVVQGIIIVTVIIYMGVNAISDVTYRLVDPRLR